MQIYYITYIIQGILYNDFIKRSLRKRQKDCTDYLLIFNKCSDRTLKITSHDRDTAVSLTEVRLSVVREGTNLFRVVQSPFRGYRPHLKRVLSQSGDGWLG